MSANNKTSFLVSTQLPEFVRTDHPQFVTFLEKYYQWLERDGAQGYVTKQLSNFLDIDTISKDIQGDLAAGEDHTGREDQSYHIFLQKFYDNFLKTIPDTVISDKTLILKHAKDFYRARGSEKALRFLLNVLTPKLFVPTSHNVNVLRLKNTLYNGVSNNVLSIVNLYKNHTITGVDSLATGNVQSVRAYYDAGTLINELVVTNVDGLFNYGENVTTTFANTTLISRLYQFEETLPAGNVVINGISIWPNKYVENVGTYSAQRDVDVYYPKRDILRASDGKWQVDRTLRVQDSVYAGESSNSYTTFQQFERKLIRGARSNTTAVVERVNRYFEGGTTIDELVVSNIKGGNFINGETVFTFVDGENGQFRISSNVFNGAINTIRVTKSGSGYNVGDPVIVESSTGANANVIVGKVSSGNIQSITVVTTGAGFLVNDVVSFTSQFGFGASGKVGAVILDQQYHPNTYNMCSSIIRTEANTRIGNTRYNSMSSIIDPANVAIFNIIQKYNLTNIGPVASIVIVDPGQNYLPPVDIDIIANTTVQNMGALGRMEIRSAGQYYQANDKITFLNAPSSVGYGAYANVTNVDINGAITRIKFESIDGYEHPGGAGYDQGHLPRSIINSTYGFGANVSVTAILGDGEVMTVANSSIGAVEELTILNRGDNYLTAPTINLSMSGDGTAQAVSTIIDGIYYYPGRFINDDGMLSSSNYLQNRDYYQNYSYVIKSKQSYDTYITQLKEMAHPAGTIPFGQLVYEDEGYADISTVDIYKTDITSIYIYDTTISTSQIPVGVIRDITVDSPGTGYAVGNPVIINNTSNSGANAVAIVGEIIFANVNRVDVIYGGAGFRVNDAILFTETEAIAKVRDVDTTGTYHPNTYTIFTSTIDEESNTAIGNTVYSNIAPTVPDPANNELRNVLEPFVYANTGPATRIRVLAAGNNTNLVPTANIVANAYIHSLGILGRLQITNGGLGYTTNDSIYFYDPTWTGSGATANVTNVAANGMIREVRYYVSADENPGGRGYDLVNHYPEIIFNTSTGNGANILVRTLIGEGEILNITNTDFGGIIRIDILNRGDGYNTAPTVDLTQSGHGNATAIVTVSTDPTEIEELL